jgi:hypothetical protein
MIDELPVIPRMGTPKMHMKERSRATIADGPNELEPRRHRSSSRDEGGLPATGRSARRLSPSSSRVTYDVPLDYLPS